MIFGHQTRLDKLDQPACKGPAPRTKHRSGCRWPACTGQGGFGTAGRLGLCTGQSSFGAASQMGGVHGGGGGGGGGLVLEQITQARGSS